MRCGHVVYVHLVLVYFFFFFQAEDGIRDLTVTGVQTCALPISSVTEAPAPAANAATAPETGRKPAPAAKAEKPDQATPARNAKPSQPADSRYKEWSFGELPELMEIGRGGQTLIGFPALIEIGRASCRERV